MSTETQIEANRENAQFSTGPKTPEGKAKSSLNAVRTGLTGRTILLPGDDVETYERHVQRLLHRYHPGNDAEKALVQSIADTEWRLLRIPSLEAGIYALGRLEFANLFEHDDPAVCTSLIEAKTFLTYQKQINNLGLQETRLRRQLEKDLASLQELQKGQRSEGPTRTPQEQSALAAAAKRQRLIRAADQYMIYARNRLSFDPVQFGFDFSKKEIEDFGATLGGHFGDFFGPLVRDRAA